MGTHNNVIVNCSVPDEPVNGTILDYDNIVTTEKSEITFQCDPGLSPEGEMTAICTNAGIWRPDPAGVECKSYQGIMWGSAILFFVRCCSTVDLRK